jgi:hypothetical protein
MLNSAQELDCGMAIEVNRRYLKHVSLGFGVFARGSFRFSGDLELVEIDVVLLAVAIENGETLD